MSQKITKRQVSQTYEFPIRGPLEKKPLKQIVYDSETGHILGRTVKGWGQLLLFYFIFYTVLASLFAICLQGLFFSLDDDKPSWILEESLIGTNPGLGYRPLHDDPEANPIIQYNAKNSSEVEAWTRRLDSFLESYRNKSKLPGGGVNQVICDFDQPPADNHVCAVDTNDFGPCRPEAGYSYNKSSPCIFLKLNKIYGWMPEFYNDKTDLPENMPETLKSYISNNLTDDKLNQIWVSCDGLTTADKDALKGQVEYYPGPGFAGYFYPYTNVQGYLSPLVAVRLSRPPTGQSINLECRLWAKNIKYHGGRDRLGSVVIELLIE